MTILSSNRYYLISLRPAKFTKNVSLLRSVPDKCMAFYLVFKHVTFRIVTLWSVMCVEIHKAPNKISRNMLFSPFYHFFFFCNFNHMHFIEINFMAGHSHMASVKTKQQQQKRQSTKKKQPNICIKCALILIEILKRPCATYDTIIISSSQLLAESMNIFRTKMSEKRPFTPTFRSNLGLFVNG